MSYQGPDGFRGVQGPQGSQGQQGLQAPAYGPQGASYFLLPFGLNAVTLYSTNYTVSEATSGSIYVGGHTSDATQNNVYYPRASLGAGNAGTFWILMLNQTTPTGGLQVSLSPSGTGSQNVYFNGTANAGSYIPNNSAPSELYLLVWDGANYLII
jgi:hypothetical protein